MKFRLGALTTNELACSLGIEFTREDEEWFRERMISTIPDMSPDKYEIGKGEWHAFDLPRLQIHAGSRSLADKIIRRLKPYMVRGVFPEEGNIKITYSEIKEEKFGYKQKMLVKERGLEVYQGYYDWGSSKEIRFYIKDRTTKNGNSVFQEIEATLNNSVFDECLAVPGVTKRKREMVYKRTKKGNLVKEEDGEPIPLGMFDKAEIVLKANEEGKYIVQENFESLELTKWNNEPVKAVIENDEEREQ